MNSVLVAAAAVAGFRHPVNTQNTTGFWVKPVEKKQQKPAPNLIQFQFVMAIIINDISYVYNCND